MPYIKDKELRAELDTIVDQLLPIFRYDGIKGNLNYFLFKLAKEFCKCYSHYSDFEGDCQQALKEIYRRLEIPYEDEKIKENGDVE